MAGPDVAQAIKGALQGNYPFDDSEYVKDMKPRALSKKLRVLVVAMGTRGDVEPCLRLAAALRKRGHVPVVLSLDAYKKEITESWGLDFRSCGIASIPISEDYMNGQTRADQVYADRGWYGDAWVDVGKRMYDAAAEGGGCDIIVATSMGNTHALDVAERRGLMCMALKFCPDIDGQVPTGSFPPSGYPVGMFGPLNFAAHVLENTRTILAVMLGGFIPKVIAFRTEIGLPSETLAEDIEVPAYSQYRQQLQANQPCLYAFGDGLVQRPPEYKDWHFFIGSLTHANMQPVSEKPLPTALSKFLDDAKAASAKVACVAFGSITQARSTPYQSRAVDAARQLGAWVLVVDPEATAEGRLEEDDKMFVMRSVPYRVLFPQVTFVIHHGGAGTLQDCMWAGVPQLAAPVLRWSDQPFWASVVEERSLGVALGAGGLPAPSVEDWRDAISQVIGETDKFAAGIRASLALAEKDSAADAACSIIEEADAFLKLQEQG